MRRSRTQAAGGARNREADGVLRKPHLDVYEGHVSNRSFGALRRTYRMVRSEKSRVYLPACQLVVVRRAFFGQSDAFTPVWWGPRLKRYPPLSTSLSLSE